MSKSVNKHNKAVESLIQYQIRDQITSLTLSGRTDLLDLTIDKYKHVTIEALPDTTKQNIRKDFICYRSSNISKSANTGTVPILLDKITTADGESNYFTVDNAGILSITPDENGNIQPHYIRVGGQITVQTTGTIVANYTGHLSAQLWVGDTQVCSSLALEGATTTAKIHTVYFPETTSLLTSANNEIKVYLQAAGLTIMASNPYSSPVPTNPIATFISGEAWLKNDKYSV